MVSLSRSFNTNSGGATFFSETGNMGDPEHLQPILDSYGTFRPLSTIPYFGVQLAATGLLAITTIAFAIRHPQDTERCDNYFIFLYAHVVLWLLTFIIDQIASRKHENMRLLGYFDYYKKTEIHHRLPFYLVSIWNSLLLLLQTIVHHLNVDIFQDLCTKGGPLSPVGYLCIAITIEFVIILVVNSSYIGSVRRFNQQRPQPDVQREEWNNCGSPEASEIGFPNTGEKLVDFLQKQADLIRFLKEHNAKLAEKLMQASARGRQTTD